MSHDESPTTRPRSFASRVEEADAGLAPGQQQLLDAVRTAVMVELGWEDDRGAEHFRGSSWDTATDVAEAAIVAVIAQLRDKAAEINAAVTGDQTPGAMTYPGTSQALTTAALQLAQGFRRAASYLDAGSVAPTITRETT